MTFDKVEYEYYVKPIDGDEIKMDYCFSGALWERSYCELDGYKYYGVEYKEKEISRIENYYLPYFIAIIAIIVGFTVFNYLIKNYVAG